jgi:hypothetical protein
MKIDPNIEAELEAKLIEVNKADMKLHLAKRELESSIIDAVCSLLPRDSDKDEIIKAAKTINAYRALEMKEKKAIMPI